MKILVISNLFPPHGLGGYEERCYQVCKYLKNSGHQVHVLTSDFTKDKPLPAHAFNESDVTRSLRVHGFFGNPWLPIQKLYKLEADNHRIVQNLIDAQQPDVIHVWNMGGISKSLLHRLEAGTIPVVYDISDHWIARSLKADVWLQWWNREGGGAASVFRKVLGALGVRGLLSKTVPTAPLDAIRWENIYFCSAYMRDTTVAAGYSVEHAAVIPCGVEVNRFKTKKHYARAKSFLWVGRIAEDKDPYTAVRGFAEVYRQHADIKLTLYGRGDDASVKKLTDLIRELGLESAVSLASATHDEMLEIYAKYDALIFSSNWGEPFALTPLEAMAAGLPVISTLDGGQQELARDGENMLVFEAGDADSLAGAISRLIALPNGGEIMAAQAALEVNANYDMPAISKRIEDFLHKAANPSDSVSRSESAP